MYPENKKNVTDGFAFFSLESYENEQEQRNSDYYRSDIYSTLFNYLGEINGRRLQLSFAIVNVENIIKGLTEIELLDQINQLFHVQVNSEILNVANPLFDALSVGIYFSKFFLNATKITIDAINKAKEENKNQNTFKYIWQGVEENHCDLLNDSLWGQVNLLTNYPKYFGISAPVANGITGVFLVFDAWLALHRRDLAKRKFEELKMTLTNDILTIQMHETLRNQITNITLENDLGLKTVDELNTELEKSRHEWDAQNAACWYEIAAAFVLLSGFSLSFALSFAGSAPACLFICSIGVTMYLTNTEFKNYYEATLNLEQAPDSQELQTKLNQTQNDFILSFIKNELLPIVFMSAIAINLTFGATVIGGYFIYNCMDYFTPKGSDVAELEPEPEPELELESEQESEQESDVQALNL